MKRIWFGAGLLIALLLLGILSNFLMQKTQLAQIEKLDHAATLASDGDWASARNLSAEAKTAWDQKRIFLCALCSHDAIDRIDGLFAQSEVYAAARSAVAFSSTCALLSQQLEALAHSHSFTAENFF